MDDIRNWSKAKLTNYIVENKECSWSLAERTEGDIREWAEGHDRDFLIGIVAGWNKDTLEKAGLRL